MSSPIAPSDVRPSQGSLWRRWDPHVHLPGTALNDQFKNSSVADALNQLAIASPRIEAIGVTDYMTTVSYHNAVAAQAAGAAADLRLIFPNVELRLDNATASDRAVNIHLLCAPSDVAELERFVAGLEFSFNERVYRGDRSGLVKLGRDFRNDSTLDEEAAFRVGVMQFKVNFEAFRTALHRDRSARSALLVGVAVGQGDGSSGLRSEDGSFAARRQSIEALADVIFSANPNDIKFWLGRGTLPVDELERVYRSTKLCLHGSDAHDAKHLGVPDQDRFCWLKGDPNFDTLKLACIAPESRSHIGPDAPNAGFSHGRVVAVSVPAPEWFVNEVVPINPGLVAIIGSRGSGKTALADLIAAGAGSDAPFTNRSSFVRRAGRLLADTSVSVEWTHGATTSCDFALAVSTDQVLRPVRYLSQQFVETLCAADGVSDELLAEIERVVFESWPVESRQGATTFRELLDLRLGSAKQRQEAQLDAVLDMSDRITDARLLKRQLPIWEKDRESRRQTLDGLEAKIRDLTKTADMQSASRLGEVSAALQVRQQELQQVDRKWNAINALAQLVTSYRATSFPRFAEKLRTEHEKAGLSEDQWAAFEVDFSGDVEAVLKSAGDAAAQAVNTLRGEPTMSSLTVLASLAPAELAACTVAELEHEVARLRDLVGLDERRSMQLKTLTATAGETRTAIAKLDAQIDQATNANTDELVARRLVHYRDYFAALLEEEHELHQLYAPLEAMLAEFGSSTAKLRFSVRRVVDVEAWASEGESLLDLRKEGRFRGRKELAAAATAELCPAWESGDAREAAEAINSFVASYSEDFRNRRLLHGEGATAEAEWERAMPRWLYRTDQIRLRYTLEYDGLSIERLSPGSRGIVLLLLYLAVDREETDPLIIDQPEENLDPESVYSELVALFRSASERRQIIMVTHNANLVVNTDVDQVIVARCGSLEEGRLPALHYVTGGLESPSIRQAVCEVLEGGAEAFRQRARRLGLDLTTSGDDDTDPADDSVL